MLTLGITTFLGLHHPISYAFILAGGTFVVYTFQRIVKINQYQNVNDHLGWVNKHKKTLLLLSVLVTLGVSTEMLRILNWSWSILAVGLIAVFLSFFYVIKLGRSNLRERPYLKVHLISLTWVLGCVIFPVLNEGDLTIKTLFFGLAHYFYILAITIPFDIRDLNLDKADTKTIPQIIGKRGAKLVSFLALVLFTLLVHLFYPALQFSFFFWLAIAFQLFFVLIIDEHSPDYFFSGIIDAGIMLLGISYLIN